ncbi:MAG: hypothetical protein GY758_15375 [Fuerstiella sp.]|jgi:hypothetical protein|nr:hypothetical protein [Fuerstiella sp.]MCP4512276.1 hypothetical protein [Fuerstiella sp.]
MTSAAAELSSPSESLAPIINAAGRKQFASLSVLFDDVFGWAIVTHSD